MKTMRNALLLGGTATIIASAAVLYVSVERTARALDPLPQQTGVTTDELQAALFFVGLDAESLTAAGASAIQATGVVENVLLYLADQPGALMSEQAALSDANVECAQLERLVRSGMGTDQDVVDCQAAQAAVQAAQASCESVADSVFAAGVADLTSPQQQTLATIRGNGSWKVPVEYLTITLTEPQWVQLRDALANERISAANGESADSDCQGFLADIESNPAVTGAQTGLDTNLPLVQAAWDEASEPE